MNKTTLLASMAVLTTGCIYVYQDPLFGDGETGNDLVIEVDTAACDESFVAAVQVLENNCYSCHANGSQVGKPLSNMENTAAFVNDYVVPFDREASRAWDEVESGRMPYQLPPLSEVELTAIATWIDCGALLEEEDPRTFIDREAVFDASAEYLRDNGNPRDIRFLDLTTWYNGNESTTQLLNRKKAAEKALNSLSLNVGVGRIVPVPVGQDVPEEIAASGLLFAVHLSDFELQGGPWTLIEDAYPYGASYDFDSYEPLASGSGSWLPVIDLVWFVHASQQPPLYHDLAGMPDNLDDWLERYGVVQERESVLVDGALVSAGPTVDWDCVAVQDSGVSSFNRVFCETPNRFGGYVYVSFDFNGEADFKNVFEHPLDFLEDGGEMIASNAAGFQQYFITDANGDRLDRAPHEVVNDPGRPTDDEGDSVINGVSCHGCHVQGMRMAADEMFATWVNADPPHPDQVALLRRYLGEEESLELLGGHREDFLATMDGININPDEDDPINVAWYRFLDRMSPELVAASVGIPLDELLEILDDDEDLRNQLRRTQIGKTVPREVFDAAFAQLICEVEGTSCD